MPSRFTIQAQTDDNEGEIRLTDNTGVNSDDVFTPPGKELFIEVTDTTDPQNTSLGYVALSREQVEILYDYLAGWLGKDKPATPEELAEAAARAADLVRRTEWPRDDEEHPRLPHPDGGCPACGPGVQTGPFCYAHNWHNV